MIYRIALAQLILFLVMASCTVGSAQEFAVFEAFTDHAVLQRNVDHPIHGWGQAGETITIHLGGHAITTNCNSDGKWTTYLPPMPAGGPHEITLAQGAAQLLLEDIYFGDVYLLSGQSNMNYRVTSPKRLSDTVRANEIADPLLRHLHVARSTADRPGEHLQLAEPWTPGTPKAIRNFSAVGAYFVDYLRKAGVEIPIGLLHSSWGGSRIEAWLPGGDLSAAVDDDVPPAKTPVILYNAMIAPLTNWPLTGTLWYQGEANSRPGDVEDYDDQLRQLVTSWRQLFAAPDLPFYWVQLPNFQPDWEKPDGHGWEVIRAKQTAALDLPRTGQAVTIDIGEAGDIHPPNKWEIGRRLSLHVLKDIYGKEVQARSPRVKEIKLVGNIAQLNFDDVGAGLHVRMEDGDRYKMVKSIEVEGRDGQWRWAIGTLNPTNNILSVTDPTGDGMLRIRYAWSSNPTEANLFTRGGLPVTPFEVEVE